MRADQIPRRYGHRPPHRSCRCCSPLCLLRLKTADNRANNKKNWQLFSAISRIAAPAMLVTAQTCAHGLWPAATRR